MSLSPILCDFLIRFQQTALKETGRRPMTWLRSGMDEALLLPGCQRPGYAFWQPVAWPEDKAPLGRHAKLFDESIREYVSVCQFLEIPFLLPVARAGSPLSFLYHRVFETRRNTVSAPPSRAFEEAVFIHREHPERPLCLCMAATCDGGQPLLMMLGAQDGQVFVQRGPEDAAPLRFRVGLDRLLPKLQFVYDR